MDIAHCKEWRRKQDELGKASSLAQYKLQHGLISQQKYTEEYSCCVCGLDLEGRGHGYDLPEGFRKVCGNCNIKDR
jgi:hypothetical protein